MARSRSRARLAALGLLSAAVWPSCAPTYEDCVFACGPHGACPTGLSCSSGLCTRQTVCRASIQDSGTGGDANSESSGGSTGGALPATGGRGQGGALPPLRDASLDAEGTGGAPPAPDGDLPPPTCDPNDLFESDGDVIDFADDVPRLRGGITISEDGLEAYLSAKFGVREPTIIIRVSRENVSEEFGDSRPISNEAGDALIGSDPGLSPDGLSLYYTNTSLPQWDIYVSRRESPGDVFKGGTPVDGVNTPDRDEADPFVSRDGTTLYFATRRDGDMEIYYIRIDRIGFDVPTPIGAVNKRNTDEIAPVVSRDNLAIYFSSTRTGGRPDIWAATRRFATDGFGEPFSASVRPSPASDYPDVVSDDGCTLWYTSSDSGEYIIQQAHRKPRR